VTGDLPVVAEALGDTHLETEQRRALTEQRVAGLCSRQAEGRQLLGRKVVLTRRSLTTLLTEQGVHVERRLARHRHDRVGGRRLASVAGDAVPLSIDTPVGSV